MAENKGSGNWLLVQELFDRCEPSFVDELRLIDDADALAAFAPRWLADKRPEARQLLFDYLDRPLNAFRHEALVKRLFKQAEAAGDDALMARFLVAFDRAVRRIQGSRFHSVATRDVETMEEAQALADSWRAQGLDVVILVSAAWHNKHRVYGYRYAPIALVPQGTTMPRGRSWYYQQASKKRDRCRLFSTVTRRYLRRRAWRYFRKLGRAHPERYVAAVREALIQYRDDDAADGLAFIDNWGLIHILFHFSPCLVADDRGWKVADGRSLAELEPAPAYAKLWEAAPRALVELLSAARCRPVRGWATRMIRRDLAAVAVVFPFEERLALLGSDDPEVAALAADMLRGDPALTEIATERWLSLVETASPASLDVLCEMMERLIAPDRVSLPEAVRLACMRPLPAASLGLQLAPDKVAARRRRMPLVARPRRGRGRVAQARDPRLGADGPFKV